jgi:hypothetical protein
LSAFGAGDDHHSCVLGDTLRVLEVLSSLPCFGLMRYIKKLKKKTRGKTWAMGFYNCIKTPLDLIPPPVPRISLGLKNTSVLVRHPSAFH